MAIRAMNAAAVNGTWVLLQNCELGLGLMNEMEVGYKVPKTHRTYGRRLRRRITFSSRQ